MNFKKLKSNYDAFTKKASELIKNKGKTLSKIEEGLKKASENKASLNNVWGQLQLFFSLTKDYATGNYTDIPKSAIISVVAALLYFISPLDFIPDFLVGLGFLDDAFILGYVYKRVMKELGKYQIWKLSKEEKKTLYISWAKHSLELLLF